MKNLWAKVFFIDIPSLIDSTWRRLDFRANVEKYYVSGDPGRIEDRPFWRMPAFWLFAILVFFVSYGPNWSGLCALAPQPIVTIAQWALGITIAGGALFLAYRFRQQPDKLVTRHFERLKEKEHVEPKSFRWKAVAFGARATAIGAVVVALRAAYEIIGLDPYACAVEGGSLSAFLQYLLCVGAVVGIAVFSSRRTSTSRLLYAQVAAIFVVALVNSFVLAHASTLEISDLPYRHVFGFWAPAIVAVLLLTPVVLRVTFRMPHPVGTPSAATDPIDLQKETDQFRQWLGKTELFIKRPDPPVLSGRRLFFAIIYGPFYHPLQLLLIPAWAALVASPQSLYLLTSLALVTSALLLTWGNISTRWEQMTVHIERWFLRGAPLIVSTLVIVLALLRVMQFDYISTILDALPFGTIFGMVVMTYVLFWFVEYWMNRVLAVRLLRIISANGTEIAVDYPTTPGVARDNGVSDKGRFVMSHGIGRVIAVGTFGPTSPTSGQQPRSAETAFNSFYFTELFSRLGEQAQTPDEATYAKDIERRIGNYFFSLNIVMVTVTAAFIGYYAINHFVRDDGIDPVLTTATSPGTTASVDLGSLLTQDPSRPAIVVVGSGGGTRAALYTATVLRGLHQLGVDQDIVLLSGVSGGGVALAYFAANRNALVAAQAKDDNSSCVKNPSAKLRTGDAWDCFERSMTEPFIEDVLNGATEWRVFSQTSLSALLIESFERRLFGDTRLGSIGGPALVLNSTIVSHPADDSDLLRRTLDKAPERGDDSGCRETERSYKLMSGGRLIFTNIRDTERFPGGAASIADIRLQYQILRDANIPLATAAALNANFPPVFPSARVRVEDGGSTCRFKDYYVTDGGAVENLGLISALYALRSAIDRLPFDRRLRPIHVVLAEASAISYDYGQDRGLSAIEGSRERLAGGLTGALIGELDDQLAARKSASPALEFHYLGLPLAFRARGGFGTHWMYAKEYHLNDPRPRSMPLLNFLPGVIGRDRKALVNQASLKELWLALHNPNTRFCDPQKFKEPESEKVWKWICGSPVSDPNGRDLHMEEWWRLVEQMRAISK